MLPTTPGTPDTHIFPRRAITLPPATRYAVAVAAAAIAVAIRVAFEPAWGAKLPFLTLFPAIALSAWLGGFWPGLLTTVICAAAADYLWLQPARSWAVADPNDVIGLAFFVAIGLMICALNEAWRRSAAVTNRAASELHRQARLLETANDALRKRTEELERVLEVIPTAVWIAKDPDCHEIVGNAAAAELFGMPVDRNLSLTPGRGQDPVGIRHFRDGREVTASDLPMQRAAVAGQPQLNEELDVELPDGRRVTMIGGAMPLLDAAGQVRGVVSSFSDITDRKRLEKQRAELLAREQAARADVDRANHLKDEFLAVLSHELRTPLNAVLGYAHLLVAGALPADRARHALDAIQRNAQAQARLVESLLDLSRVMSGKLELELQKLELRKLVDAAMDVVRPEAEAKGLQLDVVLPENDVTLYGDGGRLDQVLWNLLSNAIKFTPPGGRIGVKAAAGDGEVTLQITDTGDGISPTFLPHVFDRFKQADNRRSLTGLGLGLALVREMIHAHGGRVLAESPGEGRGSTFTITLPLSGPRGSAQKLERLLAT